MDVVLPPKDDGPVLPAPMSAKGGGGKPRILILQADDDRLAANKMFLEGDDRILDGRLVHSLKDAEAAFKGHDIVVSGMGFSGHGVEEGYELSNHVKSKKPDAIFILSTSVPFNLYDRHDPSVDYYVAVGQDGIRDPDGKTIKLARTKDHLHALKALVKYLVREKGRDKQ
ncbi:hypothetical protein ACFLRF_03730 [Candidatus Altiarchaeota archaeon]